MKIQAGNERQRQIYLRGLAGKIPTIPLEYKDLQEAARKKMTEAAFGYFEGGAGRQVTMKQNREDFAALQVVPRMLRNTAERTAQSEIFDALFPMPLYLSPIGVLELAHPKADLAVAEACKETGTPMVFSNQASYPMEKTAKILGDVPFWFQLYYSKSRKLVKSFVNRAEDCGCKAIVLTLDTTLLGWRTKDLQAAYLPFLYGKGIAQYTSDEVFQDYLKTGEWTESKTSVSIPKNLKTLAALFQMSKRYPGNFFDNLRSGIALKAVKQFINIYSLPSLNWDDVAYLQSITRLPIILKGILHPEDAKIALQKGIQGIIVSNHGGRQVDASVSSLAMLPIITKTVKGKIPVLLDSGIRSGVDIFKAIHLGATAVGLGRPFAYALALEGTAGVVELIRNFQADFDLTMGLTGCNTLADIRQATILGKEKLPTLQS